jgi:hypothetical protein
MKLLPLCLLMLTSLSAAELAKPKATRAAAPQLRAPVLVLRQRPAVGLAAFFIQLAIEQAVLRHERHEFQSARQQALLESRPLDEPEAIVTDTIVYGVPVVRAPVIVREVAVEGPVGWDDFTSHQIGDDPVITRDPMRGTISGQ